MTRVLNHESLVNYFQRLGAEMEPNRKHLVPVNMADAQDAFAVKHLAV